MLVPLAEALEGRAIPFALTSRDRRRIPPCLAKSAPPGSRSWRQSSAHPWHMVAQSWQPSSRLAHSSAHSSQAWTQISI